MPATEQEWRFPPLMHTIFAVSGLLLLVSTIWMFAADHSREWKHYQRTGRRVERDLTRWESFQFQTDQVVSEQGKLLDDLAKLRRIPIFPNQYDSFKKRVQQRKKEIDEKPFNFARIDKWFESFEELSSEGDSEEILELRTKFFAALQAIVDDAKAREKERLRLRKFQNAEYDAAKADVGIGVRDGLSQERMVELQQRANEEKEKVDDLTQIYQDTNRYRTDLQDELEEMTAAEGDAKKRLEENQVKLDKIETSADESTVTYFEKGFPYLGKRWLELPILDAFNPPLEIDNFHYPRLTVDYNFKGVARYDRCTTCHRAIDKESGHDPTKPAFKADREITLTLTTPEERPEWGDDQSPVEWLRRVYGIRIADRGLVQNDDVTVSFVRSGSLAAKAKANRSEPGLQRQSGLQLRQAAFHGGGSEVRPADGVQVGDVILAVDGNKVLEQSELYRFLLGTVDWGQSVELTLRRGLPQPYAGHPRIDLFVGPTSPHPMQTFGCTSCHEGQGSATAFKWASHTPSDLNERKRWQDERDWFNNHHWIFPMYPQRFAEASCVRCHHEVTDLQVSEHFPEPPAPKIVAGHKLVNTYGCFGCHEVNGYNGPDDRVGPDLRLEPNYYAVALQLAQLIDQSAHAAQNRLEAVKQGESEQVAEMEGGLGELTEMAKLARQVGRDWEHNHGPRHRLVEMVNADQSRSVDDSVGPLLDDSSTQLVAALKDIEAPGKLRKVGPSLRHVRHKLDAKFMYDWINQPGHFRPSTKMPQFFGLTKHLQGDDRELTEKLEPIEIHAMVKYLTDRSQAFEFINPAQKVTASAQEEKILRGKLLFETRGCLACHTHSDFPDAKPQVDNDHVGQLAFGPDLSAMGDKLEVTGNANGPKWLYSWLRDPQNYHVRTRMPNMFLEPIEERDKEGNVVKITDPAEDIAQYLLSSRSSWKPVSAAGELVDVEALDDLVLRYLSKTFHNRSAEQYLKEGVPESMRDSLKGAETELVGAATQTKKLLYIGAKSIAKYGCYGCHDVPGFEDAKPIGTGLANWGRKDPSKLDFAHISHYFEHHGHADEGHHGEDDSLDPYFQRLINEHDRAGFAMQKLREPRSYDFENVANKGYNERLRMPQFPLNAQQREAVVTFVLGLIADPPDAEYVHVPSDQTQAIVDGRQVLEKYNCGGCHILESERWSVSFEVGDFRAQPTEPLKTYPFLTTHFSAIRKEASQTSDRRNRMQALITGAPSISTDDGLPVVYDEENDEVEDEETYDTQSMKFGFDLWKSALIGGETYEVGVVPLEVSRGLISKKYPPRGGALTRYLLPRVVELEKESNANAKGSEAWGWVPPPLIGEGAKVQTAWLHDFLLDPHPIRPAVFLRMPRFNMSSGEATKLVNYFAAVDGATFPYDFEGRTRSGYVASAEQSFRKRLVEEGLEVPDRSAQSRLDHAMQIVTDNNYCIKCHLVGDPAKGGYQPDGGDRAKAPNLALVARRLRPDYVRRWIANPKHILPYTSMPVNIPFELGKPHLGGVSQALFPGTSIEQVDALVDLLMNYNAYSESHSPVAPLIKPAEPTAAVPEDASLAADPSARESEDNSASVTE